MKITKVFFGALILMCGSGTMAIASDFYYYCPNPTHATSSTVTGVTSNGHYEWDVLIPNTTQATKWTDLEMGTVGGNPHVFKLNCFAIDKKVIPPKTLIRVQTKEVTHTTCQPGGILNARFKCSD